jgi:hypothetical protein
MNLYAKPLVIAILFGTIFTGLIAFLYVQSSNAQSIELPSIENIPGYKLFENLRNNEDQPNTADKDYLEIDKAIIAKAANKVQAVLQAHGHIPKDGSGGAFGYGILTNQELSAIMVSTTHAGVLDSEDQKNANDPRWHNHYVSLGKDLDNCGPNDPAVTSITFQSPGKVVVNKDKAVLSNLPSTFTGTNALTGDPLTLSPGTNVQNVVSFVLKPVFNVDDELQAVCVTDITPADKIIKN